MTAATDHFTSFVDVLAEALDDHEATGEDLAARLYLSRFHLDRIVRVGGRRAAAAGSGAGSCSERSAFRLVTTRRHHPRHRGRGRATARTRRSPARSPGRTASRPAGGAPARRRSGSRRPATSTSTHPAASASRPRRR